MSIPSKVFAFFFMSPSTTNSLLAFNTYERFFFFHIRYQSRRPGKWLGHRKIAYNVNSFCLFPVLFA